MVMDYIPEAMLLETSFEAQISCSLSPSPSILLLLPPSSYPWLPMVMYRTVKNTNKLVASSGGSILGLKFLDPLAELLVSGMILKAGAETEDETSGDSLLDASPHMQITQGNSSTTNFDDNDPRNECVICMTEPKDTTVLPCRHMCMCNECANALQHQFNKCPKCRQPIEELIEIKMNNGDQ
ncbi:putative E3 ubiquitin-protein ligase LUL4 [Glycine soja]|uniref:RING-type E3 ubiquitin transferase n=1 Tax=Glycine soja TaxID=3848 RepID=A0A445L0T6_GLYSO|nr:putative E3 ubiquitin-protein ligase LUL4 [Glycine soja]